MFFPKDFLCPVTATNHTPCPNTALQYHTQSLVPHSSPSQPLKLLLAGQSLSTAVASCSLRSESSRSHHPFIRVSSESLAPGHVPSQSRPHTSSVIVPSQPLPLSEVRDRLHSLLLGRRPLASSYISVTVPSLSLPLGHSSLIVPASHSPRCH